MGCCQAQVVAPRTPVHSAEHHFQKAESFLGLAAVKTEEASSTLRRLASGHAITQAQLVKAFAKLQLDTSFFERFSSAKCRFFEGFTLGPRTYSVAKLETLFVLLGSAPVSVKADSLFSAYDGGCTQALDYESVLGLFEDIIDISVWLVGKLALERCPQAECDIKAYMCLLGAQRKSLSHFFSQLLFYTQGAGVGRAAFLRSFGDRAFNKLLRPASVRELAYEFFLMRT